VLAELFPAALLLVALLPALAYVFASLRLACTARWWRRRQVERLLHRIGLSRRRAANLARRIP